MKPIKLHTLHRNVGIALAPFLLLQGVTGLILSLDVARSGAPLTAGALTDGSWQRLLIAVHFGPGPVHDVYLILLAAGICWMVFSGSTLYHRGRRARAAAAARPNRTKGAET